MPLKSSETILETRKWCFKYFAKSFSLGAPKKRRRGLQNRILLYVSGESSPEKRVNINQAKLLATTRFRMQRINGERKGLDTATSSIFRPRIARDVNNYLLTVSVLVFWITRRSEGMVIVIGQNLLWQHYVFFTINVKNAIACFTFTITCICFSSECSWQP